MCVNTLRLVGHLCFLEIQYANADPKECPQMQRCWYCSGHVVSPIMNIVMSVSSIFHIIKSPCDTLCRQLFHFLKFLQFLKFKIDLCSISNSCDVSAYRHIGLYHLCCKSNLDDHWCHGSDKATWQSIHKIFQTLPKVKKMVGNFFSIKSRTPPFWGAFPKSCSEKVASYCRFPAFFMEYCRF